MHGIGNWSKIKTDTFPEEAHWSPNDLRLKVRIIIISSLDVSFDRQTESPGV
jgi:hypothetical protein